MPVLRDDPAQHDLVTPRDLAEALTLLADGQSRPLSGGTDLMVLLAAGKLPPRRYVNLWALPELRGILVNDEGVQLGGLTTYREVQRHPLLAAEFPMLGQAASETGGVAIQSRGTLAGNIANASPAADSPPALLCYEAELLLRDSDGARRLPYRDFHTGYKQTRLRPGELIEGVWLPRRPGRRVHLYRKVGPRQAQAISKVCFAGCAELDAAGRISGVRVALGGVAPTVTLLPRTAQVLRDGLTPDSDDDARAAVLRAAQATLQEEIAPISDMRSNAAYRRAVAQNLLAAFARALRAADGSAKG